MNSTKDTATLAAVDRDAEPTALPLRTTPVRSRKTLQDRLQEVIEQQQQLAAQKRAIASQQRAEARARMAQVESMIGAACWADESIKEFVQAALDKHFTDDKNRAFLKSEGWL